ncbi:MAG: HlyC/CorC family transporter [Anaerolineae bacterium]|nr:HlyC/CorC family transporter [Anaerolineae bacterium]
MDSLFGVLAVLALVLANGFFVAAEFSLVSARRTRIDQLAQEGNRAAVVAKKAIEHLDSYIAATQLGITLASLALGFIGEPAIGHLFEGLLHAILPNLDEQTLNTIVDPAAIAAAFALVTLLHIVIGELVPKSIALQRPESTALFVARPTTWFHAIFRPVIRLMNGVGNAIVRMLGFEPSPGHSNVHSPEELEMLVQSSREAGLLQENEEKLLRRVFDFSDVQIKEVMRPRPEVDAIPQDIPLSELLSEISSLHYSRFPVYQGTVDTVVGILNVKDLFDTIVKTPQLVTGNGTEFNLQNLLRAPVFVPQTTTVDLVLDQMQRTKQQIVIVIDEYGGMAGIATMEDILEELVGEVQDEFDAETAPVESKGDVMLVDGLMTLSDAADRFGALKDGEKILSTTLGGYVNEQLERIAVVGDVVQYGDYDVKVVEMDGLRVAKVRFIKRQRQEAGI